MIIIKCYNTECWSYAEDSSDFPVDNHCCRFSNIEECSIWKEETGEIMEVRKCYNTECENYAEDSSRFAVDNHCGYHSDVEECGNWKDERFSKICYNTSCKNYTKNHCIEYHDITVCSRRKLTKIEHFPDELFLID